MKTNRDLLIDLWYKHRKRHNPTKTDVLYREDFDALCDEYLKSIDAKGESLSVRENEAKEKKCVAYMGCDHKIGSEYCNSCDYYE